MTVLNLFLGLGEPLNAPINTPLPTHINRIRHNNYYDVFPKQVANTSGNNYNYSYNYNIEIELASQVICTDSKV